MTTVKNLENKRAYSAPKLVAYGDMAKLTKGGTGSQTEPGTGGTKTEQPRP